MLPPGIVPARAAWPSLFKPTAMRARRSLMSVFALGGRRPATNPGASRMLFVRAYPRESQGQHIRSAARAGSTTVRRNREQSGGLLSRVRRNREQSGGLLSRRTRRRSIRSSSARSGPVAAWLVRRRAVRGQVENQVGPVRGRFFIPRLRARSLGELNAWLMDQCILFTKAHHHPEFRTRTIWQVFGD